MRALTNLIYKMAKGAGIVAGVLLALGSAIWQAEAGFVYDTAGELLTSGDFNADGVADLLVLDKATGNARVGYLDTNGVIAWSAPLVSGVENATSLAIGRFLNLNVDSMAVTAPDLNHVNLVSLSNSNSAGAPVTITPAGIGPHTLVSLPNPLGIAAPGPPFLVVASADNGAASEAIELWQINAGAPSPAGNFSESGFFDRGNRLILPPGNSPDYAAGLVRGDSDRFDILQFTNVGGVLVSMTNLPSGSDYVFGNLSGEPFPRLIFYQTGSSNLSLVSLTTNSGTLAMGTTFALASGEVVQHVFFLGGSNSGSALILFSDGVQALTLNGGTPVLGAIARSGRAGTNNTFTGIIPLANGQFALLDGPAGSLSSSHAQIVKFDGTNFSPISSSSLPSTASRNTRANVWLFQSEPFVNRYPGFLASFSLPDWSDNIVSLTPAILVSGETDGGLSLGLNSPATNSIGATPGGGNYAMPNQYRDAISVFSYAAPRAPDAVSVTISPSPGIFSGSVQISFNTLSAGDKVFYRTATKDGWHSYLLPFLLTNSSTVQYYGTNSAGARSRLLTAGYSIATNLAPVATYNLSNAVVSTNTGGAETTNGSVVLSQNGTVFYSRVNLTGGSIWAINLDGSGDTYITTGARPRASRDGRYLAFSRGPNVFGASGGDVWVRDLQTGMEWEIFPNQPPIVGYDWDLAGPPSLLLDAGCNFWKVTLGGVATLFSVSHDCNDNFPVINPLDGRVAFENLSISSTNLGGIYVAAANGGSLQHLLAAGPGAREPAWSPDGKRLAFGFLTSAYISPGRQDIFTINADGTAPSQISAHTNTVDGFPHGTIWAPAGNALIGAGTINATNGLWIIPLTSDGGHCDCPAILLPTSTGDPIDFAGSVVSAPETVVAAPGLYIRSDPNQVVVYWSTNYQGFGLQSTPSLGTDAVWTAVAGPYFLNGNWFEYHESKAALQTTRYFRLQYPTIIYVTPLQPKLVLTFQTHSNQIVLNWLTNYAGYTLESTANLAAPVMWLPITNGIGTLTNGQFEFRTNVDSTLPREFFRLRWP